MGHVGAEGFYGQAKQPGLSIKAVCAADDFRDLSSELFGGDGSVVVQGVNNTYSLDADRVIMVVGTKHPHRSRPEGPFKDRVSVRELNGLSQYAPTKILIRYPERDFGTPRAKCNPGTWEHQLVSSELFIPRIRVSKGRGCTIVLAICETPA